MTQKNETPVASKPVTETNTTPAKLEKPQATQRGQTKTINSASVAGDLPLEMVELVELVTELRGTVRRLDPRKHTEKTLRRVLFNISDNLKDIEALYTQS
jgi:hypothetical protein